FRLADRTAVRVASPYFRKSALMWVAAALAKTGDVEVARETFDRMIRAAATERPSERVKSLTDIVNYQFRANPLPEARETLKAAQAAAADGGEEAPSNSAYRLVMACLEVRDYDQAIAIAERFTGRQSNLQASFLGDIARWTEYTDRETAGRTLTRALELS